MPLNYQLSVTFEQSIKGVEKNLVFIEVPERE